MPSSDILLVAVNARYGHCSFAARCLVANLGAWRERAEILETDLDVAPFQLAAEIASRQPRVAGFSVYLWNAGVVRETLSILQRVAPGIRLVVGGPEIAPETADAWLPMADAAVVGEGETAFRQICEQEMLDNSRPRAERPGHLAERPGHLAERPGRRVMGAEEAWPGLVLPYDLYTDADLARRTLYVESSRGCPFRCAYCTSGATRLRLAPPDLLFPAFDRLLDRGARAFRFLDRSFNASEEHACGVLDFFLARRPARLSLHVEVVPTRLGDAFRNRLLAFPPGVLHLEVGVQTLNPAVARRVGRAGDPDTAMETIGFLMSEARATVHVDLIFGLPGEDEASFAAGFDRLVRELDPPELQVNLLKRLPGTPLATDPQFAGLVFNPNPPYELLASDAMDFGTVNRLQSFARCWELVHNRGRFPRAAARVWQEGDASPFARYAALAAQIRTAEGRLHALGADRLGGHLTRFLTGTCGLSPADSEALVASDRASFGATTGPCSWRR
jgi:hypothetical protein